jgi:hypothetical protein
VLAHSGATIGWNDTVVQPMLDPEIPVSHPTIRQQVGSYQGDPLQVRWVVINGGINDVDIHRILNPLIAQRALDEYTQRYCAEHLISLLNLTARTFANARLFVIGYYPILSYQSDPLGIEAFFEVTHAVKFQPLVEGTAFKNALVDHCLRFWTLSREKMKDAVAQSNTAVGKTQSVFVDPGFTEANAVFAPAALLWGVGTDPLQAFPPLDEVSANRIPACLANVADPLNCFTCCRASAGHPNVAGAAQIAAKLLQSL